MKFIPFIKNHKDDITNEWVKFAKDNIEVVKNLDLEEARDHIKQMLERIIESMETKETDDEQEEKSKGNTTFSSSDSKAANQHGEQRADVGFNIMELSSEFRALRASVLRLWEANNKEDKSETDFQDMIRFNEVIDELWIGSLQRFDAKVDDSKNWYMGILGHDLRNPLASILGVQSILKLSKNISEKEKSLIKVAESSVKRMNELIDNLLELTNLRLGSGITINKTSIDLSLQVEKIVKELQLGHPKANFIVKTPEAVQGEWDGNRLDQLMTNVITNAVRYGTPGTPITISTAAEGNKAFFTVHNEGRPVPEKIKAMVSTGVFTKTKGDPSKQESYGLGLFIVKAIVDGHNGEIEVESNAKSGTTFTIILPRHE